jgi:hypothetical protein
MRPPGYPVFLAAIFAPGGGIAAVRVVQYFALALTLMLVTRLLTRHAGPVPLFFVTAVTLLYPVQFYTAATLYPQTLSAALFLLALVLTLREPRSVAVNLLAGVIWGALFLVVPTFVLTLGVVLAVGWWLRLVRIADAVPIFVGVVLMVSVWVARNEIVFGRFVPFATNSGENLLIGNCENTIPYGGSGNVDRSHYTQEVEAQGLDEFAADKYYQHAALTWIKEHPGHAFVLYLEKAANYFNVYNAYAPGTTAEVSPWKQIVMAASYIVLLALLAWRLVESGRHPLDAREKFLLAIYVLTAFTMAIFVTRIRYRLPYDFLIIAIIAGHLQRRVGPWLERSLTKSTSAGG